jgi:fibronectin-binding autotransporter adhesin
MRLTRLAVVMALLLPLVSVQATDRHWDGSEDREWARNQNWAGGPTPSDRDNAVFDSLFPPLNQPSLAIDESVGGIWMTGAIVPDVTIFSGGVNIALTLQGNQIGNIGDREPGVLGLLVDNVNGNKLTISATLILGSTQTWRNQSNNVVTILGPVDLSNHSLTIDGPGNFEIDGEIVNNGIFSTGAVILNGPGVRSFTGGNSYDGQTLINGGTLIIKNDTGLGGTTGEGTRVASGAQLQLQGSIAIGNEALTLNGVGNASDPATGAGALRSIAGNNSMAGQITLGSDSTIICGGDTLTLTGSLDTAGFAVTFGGDSNIDMTGSIIGSGALIKNDTGTLTLSGVNGYSGGSTINGGTVIISNPNSLGVFGGAATINNATLEAAATITTSRNFVLGSANSTIAVDDTFTFTTTGVFSGTGALNKNGNGTMVLGGDNTYAGATNVNSGILNIQNSNALGTTAGGTTVSSGAELQMAGGITVGPEALTLNGSGTAGGGALRNLSGDNSFAGVITLGSATTIKSDSGVLTLSGGLVTAGFTATFGGGSDITVTGGISGTGGIAKNDGGTVTLSQANSYTGATTVNGGILRMSADERIADASNLIVSGGTFDVQTFSETVANVTMSTGAITGTGGGTLTASAFTFESGAATAILGGSGATLTKTTNGTVILSGDNSYTGSTNVNAGTLQISASERIAGTSDLNVSGGTFDVQNLTETVRNVTLSSGSISGTGAGTLAGSSFSVESGTATAILAGTGATLTKTTIGTVTLSGANTFTGATTVNGGTLTLSSTSGSALGSTTSVTVNSGGSVVLGANNQINDTAPMILSGGAFAKGNFSEGSTSTAGVGALTLMASGSHIDFGSGTVGVLTFASFTPGTFTLTIDNWTGSGMTIGNSSTDRLIFAADQTANLSSFVFTGYLSENVQFDLGNGFFEVVPVPETTTWIAAALAAAVAGLHLVRRRRAPTSRIVSTTHSFTPRQP